MKKRVLIGISLLLAAVCLAGIFTVQSSKIIGEEGLIAKARKEIKNLADVETVEMTVAGKSTIDHNRHMFWIITGNEYQTHQYYPMEVIEIEKGVYELVHMHNGGTQRGEDIFFEFFGWGHSFIVNNPKCKSMVIDGTVVPVTEIPFVYYHPSPHEYYFLDENENQLN